MSVRINVGATFNARDLQRAQRELDALKRSVTTLSGRMQAFASKMSSVGASMSRVGRNLSRNVTAPLVAVGGYAIKTAADFETSFAKIQGLVGVAAEDIGELEQAARTLGAQYGRSANDAAEALFFITSAGLRGSDAIETLEASLKASVAGLGDTQLIADLATSALNAYGSEVLSASDATDVLTNAVRLGKVQPDELAGAMGQVLPIASAMGVEFHEVGAAFAAMSRTGTNAEVAATQLRQIMATILQPTVEAEKAMTEVGLSAEGLRRQIREEGLLSVLQTLVGAFDGNVAATSEVFGNIRALSGVLDLMGSNVAATTEIFDGMASSTGVLDEAFGIAADTAQFRFQQSVADLKESLLGLGQELMPVAEELVGFIKDVAEAFRDLNDDQQAFIIKAAAVAAVAGPLIVVIGSLTTAIGGLGTALSLLAAHPVVAAFVALAAVVGISIYKTQTMTDEQRAAADAARENEAAQRRAALGYDKYTESAGQAADAARLQGAAERWAAEQGIVLGMERSNAAAAARYAGQAALYQAQATDEATESTEDAAAAANSAASAIGGTDGLTEKVVALSDEMREFLQGLNLTYAGLGGVEGQVAEFARELLAAGQITEDTAGAVDELARAVRADLDAALRDGQRRLDDARRTFEAYRDSIARGISSGNELGNALRDQAAAQERLKAAAEDYNRARRSGDSEELERAAEALGLAQQEQGDLLDFLSVGVDTAQAFAGQIEALVDAGASLSVVQQIANLGAETGARAAAELLAGGAAAIRQANELVGAVEDAARRVGLFAAQRFYGAGVVAAEAFVSALESRLDQLEDVLTKISGMVSQAMGGPTPPPAPVRRVPAYDPRVLTEQKALAISRIDVAALERFRIPGFAEGGLVTGPTLGMIGEAGPELVIPLDRLGGGGGTTINVTVTSADPQAVVEALRRYTRGNGPLGQVVNV